MNNFWFQIIQKKIIHQRTAKCLIDIKEDVLSYVSTAKPSVESYENELEYQHAVFLQKIIKGRAIQSILHDGKDTHQELIDQLKETFKLEAVWKAECFDDWNEENLMDFLGTYIDQEFARYAKQKEIYDRRMLAEREIKQRQQQDIEKENEIQKETEEVALGYIDDVFKDVFNILSKSDHNELSDRNELPDRNKSQVSVSPLTEESSKIIVAVVLSNSVLPEIYKMLPDENSEDKQIDQQNEHQFVPSATTRKEELVQDAIENLLQKVIPHPAEDEANDIIDDIVKKTIEWSSSLEDLNADSLEKEIGGMLDDLCDQLLKNFELNDNTNDESESENDSPDG